MKYTYLYFTADLETICLESSIKKLFSINSKSKFFLSLFVKKKKKVFPDVLNF